MKKACLGSAYLAPVSYYAKLYHYPYIEVETWCSYTKQTYRNRCQIVAAQGIMPLTVPVEKAASGKALTRDIRISDHGNWRHLHWNAIVSAYNSTPFFEYYADDFQPFFEKSYGFLVDFNRELCQTVCRLLGISPEIRETTVFRRDLPANERDFREIIHPKKRLSGIDTEFKIVPYYQVFQERFGFIADMSILDLLFNMGPESILILKESVVE